MAWTPTNWNNITSLKFSRHHIWVPDVFVFKIVDEVKQLSDLFAVSSPKLDDVAVLIKDNYDALNKQREDLSDFTFQFILSIIVGITILILVLSTIIGNKISSPVIALTNVLKSLSENDLSVQVPGVNRKDEIGSMAKAVEVLKRNTIRMQELDASRSLSKTDR